MVKVTIRIEDGANDPGTVFVAVPGPLAEDPAVVEALTAAGANLVVLGDYPEVTTTPRALSRAWEVVQALGKILWGNPCSRG